MDFVFFFPFGFVCFCWNFLDTGYQGDDIWLVLFCYFSPPLCFGIGEDDTYEEELRMSEPAPSNWKRTQGCERRNGERGMTDTPQAGATFVSPFAAARYKKHRTSTNKSSFCQTNKSGWSWLEALFRACMVACYFFSPAARAERATAITHL